MRHAPSSTGPPRGGVRAPGAFETESYDVAQAFVATGAGVAMVSRLALTHLPGTVHRGLAGSQLSRSLCAVTAADHGVTPMVATFLRLPHEVADDITGSWPAA